MAFFTKITCAFLVLSLCYSCYLHWLRLSLRGFSSRNVCSVIHNEECIPLSSMRPKPDLTSLCFNLQLFSSLVIWRKSRMQFIFHSVTAFNLGSSKPFSRRSPEAFSTHGTAVASGLWSMIHKLFTWEELFRQWLIFTQHKVKDKQA
jgi:hypothetical protein